MAPATATATVTCVDRNLAHFDLDIWGDYFTSFILDTQLLEKYNSEVDVLKEQVRAMFSAAGNDTVSAQIRLIDTIERLGLSYQFENEIDQLLEQMFADHKDDTLEKLFQEGDDLFTVSLHFRIFRQHGYHISTDVFNRFTDSRGKFLETLTSDIMGMLSLYEAAYLMIHADNILEEALSFTTKHLKKCSDETYKSIPSPIVVDHVAHALDQPLHRGLPRLEAKHYITVYQHHPAKDDTILRLAKLDFNRIQMIQKKELSDISRWWKAILTDVACSYARDRAVEAYFWSAGITEEPKYALARAIVIKTFLTLTLADDTYDAYASYEELQPFTDAWQKWDIEGIDSLQDYMKRIIMETVNVYNEIGEDLAREGKPYAIHYGIEGFKEMTRCYGVETQWLKANYVPTLDEFWEIQLRNSMDTLHTTSILGMGEHATIEAIEWVFNKPKIVVASSLILRILNDIAGYEHEHERIHIPTSMDCYMKEHNVSKEEAYKGLYKMVEDAWKDVNQEMLRPSPVSRRHVLMPILNLLRNGSIVFKYDVDAFTKPEKLRHLVEALYIDPHEHERIHIPTSPDCYMKEHNVSKEEAYKRLYKMVEDAWKDVNQEMLRPSPVSRRHVLMPILNLLRNGSIVYKYEVDALTKPEKLRHLVEALYIDPIPI